MHFTKKYALLFYLTVFFVTYLSAEYIHSENKRNWQYWKGPNKDNTAENEEVNLSRTKKDIKILWKTNIGDGFSNISISGDRLCSMGFNKKRDRNTLYCLDLYSGKKLWKYSYKSTEAKYYPGPKSTPVIDNDRVYSLSQDGVFMCNDLYTGKLLWKKDIFKDYGGKELDFEISSSVSIYKENAIINLCRSGIAFNKITGELLWKSTEGKSNYSSPVIFNYNKETFAAIFSFDRLNIIDVTDGTKLWSYNWTPPFHVSAADPVIYENYIFISSGYDYGSMLIDFSSGKPEVIWRNKELCSQYSTPIIIDGYIYGIDGNFGSDTYLKCLDMKDGSLRWEKEFKAANMIVSDDNLILLTAFGSLYVVKADPNSFQEILSYPNILEKYCFTAPVLCRSSLYLRNDRGDIISIDLSD